MHILFHKHISEGKRQFDAVFSNAALHWILRQAPDKLAVFKSVHALLTPPAANGSRGPATEIEGGRFVAELGGALNIAGIRSAIHRALKKRGYDAKAMDPWYFPGVEECTKVRSLDIISSAYPDSRDLLCCILLLISPVVDQLLKEAGFEVKEIGLVPRITPLPNGVIGFLRTFFLGQFLADTVKDSNQGQFGRV